MDANTQSLVSQGLQIGIPSLVAIVNAFFLYRQSQKTSEMQLSLTQYEKMYSEREKLRDKRRENCQDLIKSVVKIRTAFENYTSLVYVVVSASSDPSKQAVIAAAREKLIAVYTEWHSVVMNDFVQAETISVLLSNDEINAKFNEIKMQMLQLSRELGYGQDKVDDPEKIHSKVASIGVMMNQFTKLIASVHDQVASE